MSCVNQLKEKLNSTSSLSSTFAEELERHSRSGLKGEVIVKDTEGAVS